MAEYIKINNKQYEVKGVEGIVKEEYEKIMENYVEGVQEVLVYDMILRNIMYRIVCDYFKEGNVIDNELDVLNIRVKKELLKYGDYNLSKNDMVISIGVYKEYSKGTSDVISRYVFSRC